MSPTDILGQIKDIETIAVGRSIREFDRLVDAYGPGRWRQLKGLAYVTLPDGIIRQAEIHWYEAHGGGRKEIKIKRIVR